MAVSGVCLTAVDPADGAFNADLSPETVARSSLGSLAAGDPVNLELPLRPADRMGGHIVQGHVDGVGHDGSRERRRGTFATCASPLPPDCCATWSRRARSTVDGVSLTVTEVDDAGFSVSLIPETLARTTLGTGRPGRPVNLEVDVIAKHVEKLLQR